MSNINTIINWGNLIETGQIQEATSDEDYILVGSFNAGKKNSSMASRTREYMIKVSDFLATVGTLQDLASVLAVGNTAGTNDILLGLNQLQLVGDSIYQDGSLNILGATGGVYVEDETGASMEFSAGFGLDIIGASQLWLDTTTSDGTLKFPNANGAAFLGTLGSLALTGNRTWRLPDASGTVALTSDLPLKATVDMTAAQIIGAADGNSGSFELLIAPAANQYYEIESMVFEYTDGGINYTGAPTSFLIQSGSLLIALLSTSMFKSVGADSIAILRSGSVNNFTNPEYQEPILLGGNISILSDDLTGLATGNGTLKIKLTYFLRTVG